MVKIYSLAIYSMETNNFQQPTTISNLSYRDINHKGKQQILPNDSQSRTNYNPQRSLIFRKISIKMSTKLVKCIQRYNEYWGRVNIHKCTQALNSKNPDHIEGRNNYHAALSTKPTNPCA